MSERTVSPLDSPDWLIDLERTEERCRRYLQNLRWPEGVCCPRCGRNEIGDIPSRRRYYCRDCRYQFSSTAGTVFHNSHLAIWKWFVAIELLLAAEAGLPANQLVRLLGGSYKTAWFVEHRIRAAIVQAGEPAPGARVASRSVAGSYHRPTARYLNAYLAEATWRRRNRGNPQAFRDTLRALLAAEPVPYHELIGAQDSLRQRSAVSA